MSAFARSLPPILRISRHTLRQRNGLNPVQQVLCRGQNGAQVQQAYRGLATVFERNKPHVNIGRSTKPPCGLLEFNISPKVPLATSITERQVDVSREAWVEGLTGFHRLH